MVVNIKEIKHIMVTNITVMIINITVTIVDPMYYGKKYYSYGSRSNTLW